MWTDLERPGSAADAGDDGLVVINAYDPAGSLGAKKGVSGDNTHRSYLKFDVSGIGEKNRVTLRLSGWLSSGANRHVVTTVYAVTDVAWREDTVTWNSRPALGAVLGSVAVEGAGRQAVDIDVTALIRSELRAGRRQISVALRNVTHTSASTVFASREAADGGPQLVIERLSGARTLK